ncbi:MAG TPA: DUF4332 domain-containing protein [Dehalococcoidia bacterium]
MTFLLESPATVEGIGPQRAQALAAAKIETIAEMFGAGAPRVAKLIPAASKAQIGGWFCAAALRRVEGVTPDIAEAFVAGGVRSVGQLADAGLQTLEQAVKAAREANRLQQDISLYKLAELQRKAWRIRGLGMLAGRIFDDGGAAIAGVEVSAGGDKAVSDAAGRYAFEKLEPGTVYPSIAQPGRGRSLHALSREIRAGKLTGPVVHRLPAVPQAQSPAPLLDEIDGEVIVYTPRNHNHEVTLPLSQFKDGTLFLVRDIKDNGETRLLDLYKALQDDTILIRRATVQRSALPAGAATGTVVQLQAGALTATSYTSTDVATLKRQKWLAAHPPSTRTVISVT